MNFKEYYGKQNFFFAGICMLLAASGCFWGDIKEGDEIVIGIIGAAIGLFGIWIIISQGSSMINFIKSNEKSIVFKLPYLLIFYIVIISFCVSLFI